MTWSVPDTMVLARVVDRAPSVHHTRPWILGIGRDCAELSERVVSGLPEHDPLGRDRVISCGAALANLELAARWLGKAASMKLLPDARRTELVGRLRVCGTREPDRSDTDRYVAVFRRRSHRSPFGLGELTQAELRALRREGASTGVEVRAFEPRTDSAPLAELLRHAASVLGHDERYQRELEAWTWRFPEPLPAGSSVPWAGLVRGDTRVPDLATLTARLETERLLLFLTPGDTRRDHLLAGIGLQRTWLTAVTRGLVASVLTQPFRVQEVRAGLIERFELAGYPQLFLRVGHR